MENFFTLKKNLQSKKRYIFQSKSKRTPAPRMLESSDNNTFLYWIATFYFYEHDKYENSPFHSRDASILDNYVNIFHLWEEKKLKITFVLLIIAVYFYSTSLCYKFHLRKPGGLFPSNVRGKEVSSNTNVRIRIFAFHTCGKRPFFKKISFFFRK